MILDMMIECILYDVTHTTYGKYISLSKEITTELKKRYKIATHIKHLVAHNMALFCENNKQIFMKLRQEINEDVDNMTDVHDIILMINDTDMVITNENMAITIQILKFFNLVLLLRRSWEDNQDPHWENKNGKIVFKHSDDMDDYYAKESITIFNELGMINTIGGTIYAKIDDKIYFINPFNETKDQYVIPFKEYYDPIQYTCVNNNNYINIIDMINHYICESFDDQWYRHLFDYKNEQNVLTFFLGG
jgi:frataxin-like iron-binding protein CyaY